VSQALCQLLVFEALSGLMLFASAVPLEAQSTTDRARTMSICELVAKGKQYDRKVVRVSAHLLSDDIHPMVLVDSRCKLGVTLVREGEGERHSRRSMALDDLDHALATGMAGTLDKEISGVFVGRFRCRRQPRRAERLLELFDVFELSVVKK